MSRSLRTFGFAAGAVVLTCLPAAAQTKVTNEGISASEIVIGTHQDLSGPIKGWGVPVSNGMKMAVEEINAAGGVQGRKIRLVVEDSGYDPKKAVLASQKLIERDKIFAMVGAMGSPTVLAAQDILLDAGVLQLFPLTAAEFTFKFDPAKPQERLKFNNLLPYVESTRAALKYMMEWKNFKKPCIMHQDDEYGKNVLDGFNQQLTAMKVQPASITSYKRGASDFSAQIAKMKSDSCDLVVLGAVLREPIGAMTEAKKLGWDVTFLGATPTNVMEVPMLGKEAVEGLYAASGFEIPYEDTAKGKVKDWLVNYKKMFNTDANTQAIIGYNAVTTFAFYANKAGKDLTGQKMLDALESGDKFLDIFNSPPTKFSKTDHLANNHHPGAAGQGRPLGSGEGQSDVLIRVRGFSASNCQRIRSSSSSPQPSPHKNGERERTEPYDPPPAVPEFTGASSSSRQRQPSAAFTNANVRWILRRRVTLKASAERSLLPTPGCGRPVLASQQVPVHVVATLLQVAKGARTAISISPVTCASCSPTWLSSA
ncbi:branched-chain amino acid transport system substrate-binding protein [Bradyrhizobium sp. F1.13.4]